MIHRFYACTITSTIHLQTAYIFQPCMTHLSKYIICISRNPCRVSIHTFANYLVFSFLVGCKTLEMKALPCCCLVLNDYRRRETNTRKTPDQQILYVIALCSNLSVTSLCACPLSLSPTRNMGVKCQHEIIRCLKAFMNNKVRYLSVFITLIKILNLI